MVINNTEKCAGMVNLLNTNDYVIQPKLNKIIICHKRDDMNSQQQGIAISDIFNLQCNVFFINEEGIVLNANQRQINFLNLDVQEAIGQSLQSQLNRASYQAVLKNNQNILKNNNLMILEESIISKDGEVGSQVLSFKLPCYHESGKLVGIFGYGIVYGKDNVAALLTNIHQMGMLNCPHSYLSLLEPIKINDIHLTPRELECMKLTSRGRTAKEIAVLLNISSRTVEFHLKNIKSKLGINSKKKLIEFFMDSVFSKLII